MLRSLTLPLRNLRRLARVAQGDCHPQGASGAKRAAERGLTGGRSDRNAPRRFGAASVALARRDQTVLKTSRWRARRCLRRAARDSRRPRCTHTRMHQARANQASGVGSMFANGVGSMSASLCPAAAARTRPFCTIVQCRIRSCSVRLPMAHHTRHQGRAFDSDARRRADASRVNETPRGLPTHSSVPGGVPRRLGLTSYIRRPYTVPACR